MDEDRLTVMCPHLEGKRVVVMPGHVNNNWGVRALMAGGLDAYQSENEIALDVAVKVWRYLGYTNAKPKFLHGSWERKWLVVKKFDADYVIELHGNAAPRFLPNRLKIRGIEAWVGTDLESRYAAALAIKRVREATGLPVHGDYPGEANDGIHFAYQEGNKRRALFERVKLPRKGPLVLFEMGFLSNVEDCQAITRSAIQDRLALALILAIDDYFRERGNG